MVKQTSNHLFHISSRFAFVRLSLNYYMLYDSLAEYAAAYEHGHAYVEELNGMIKEYLLGSESGREEALTALGGLRERLTKNMETITSYVDHFQLYEYVLNRVEYRQKSTDEIPDINVNTLTQNCCSYIFSAKDSALTNARIQEIVGQLPVRLTKSKFYSLLREGLLIYKGGRKESLDDMIYMLRTSASLYFPEDQKKNFDILWQYLEELGNTPFKDLSSEQFDHVSGRMAETAGLLMDLSGFYLMLQEIVNDIYLILLTKNYSYTEIEEYQTCMKLLRIIHQGFLEADRQIEDEAAGLLVSLEGKQERLYEKYLEISAKMEREGTNDAAAAEIARQIEMLLSGSHFVSLTEDSAVGETADEQYFNQQLDKLTAEYEQKFYASSRLLCRSIMAKTLSTLPVFFQSADEIKSYVKGSLEACSDPYELAACADLVEELMVSADEMV